MQTESAPAFFLALRDGDTVTVRKMVSTADAQSWIDYQSDLGYTPLYIAALLNKLHLENNEDFEKLYVAILQFVLKGIFLETLKEEKICFPEKHSFN